MRKMSRNPWLVLLLFLGGASFSVNLFGKSSSSSSSSLSLVSAGYTHRYRATRICRNQPSPSEAYQRCLLGWRRDNFRLFLLPPIVLSRGDETTGVGFQLCRIPPAGLCEEIIDCETTTTTTTSRSAAVAGKNTKTAATRMTMHYRVSNPGWFTFPVSKHRGQIDFVQEGNDTRVDWQVFWTPYPQCEKLTQVFVKLIIDQCVAYVALDS